MENIATEQLEGNMAKCTREQQKSPLLLSKVMEKQFTRFICITYQGKQDGSVLGTNE